MDTLKTLQHHIHAIFNSFQYFVQPPGVGSTARYCVFIDKMSMNILLRNGHTHLTKSTHEFPDVQLQRVCTNLPFQYGQRVVDRIKIQTFRSPSECLHVVCYTHYYCVSSRVTLYVILCQHHTEIDTDMKRKNLPNDVMSIPHRSYVSLNGYTRSFRMHKNSCSCSVMLIFAIFNVFHKRQSTRNTFLPNSTTTLPYTRSPST